MKGQQQIFSHASDDWTTPPDLYKSLNTKYKFSYDPCPLNSKINSLLVPWIGRVFCNPPYSKIKEFIKKGCEEVKLKNAKIVVFLLPVRTSNAWFHDFLYKKRNVEIRFLRGRLKFGKSENSAPFPSMVVVVK